jgi:cell filamentation protein
VSADPYVYPDSNVLRNLQDIRDPDQLRQVEANLTRLRALRIAAQPIPGRYDLAHLQRFHHELFDGLYAWAGQLRTVAIARTDLFCLPAHLTTYGREIFAELGADKYLHGLPRDAFIERLAHHMGNVNALHPFREGNGRAQRAFFSQLAGDRGYQLRWQHVDPECNIAAAIASMHGNEQPLRELLDDITTTRGEPAPPASLHDHLRLELDRLHAASFPDPPQPGRPDNPPSAQAGETPADRDNDLER